jgi:hypothetical protein
MLDRSPEAVLSAPDSDQACCVNMNAKTKFRPAAASYSMGVIPKNYDGINPKTGKEWARTPAQDISVSARAQPHSLGLDRSD